MKPNALPLIATFATLLTWLYLMTARVYSEGSLGESYLVLKPYPSLLVIIGGGEEGAWVRAHPNVPLPWWQQDNVTKLLYGGDWEDPVLWTSFYEWGIVLTPLLWLSFLFFSLRERIKKWNSPKTDV